MRNESVSEKPAGRRRPRFLVRVTAVAVGILIAAVCALAVDRLAGILKKPEAGSRSGGSRQRATLLLEPSSKVRHVTREFDYVATTNSFGLRGAEPDSGSKIRIVVIGDSFAYGWGVADSATWPVILGRNLRGFRADATIEVINAGAPGASPREYADAAERIIPVMRPHLVVVALLQGQDYAQTWWSTQTPAERLRMLTTRELLSLTTARVVRWTSRVFPNLVSLVSARPAKSQTSAHESEAAAAVYALREQAGQIERRFGDRERRAFEQLDDSIKVLFRSGNLNPAELYYAMKRPDYFVLTSALESARGKEVIEAMGSQLHRIRTASAEAGARAIVVSTPYGYYVSRMMCDAYSAKGYRCADSLYRSSSPDRAIEMAARAAGLPFVQVTDSFAAALDSTKTPLYFLQDGHFTEAGHRTFADLLTPFLLARLDGPGQSRRFAPNR